MTKQHFSTRFFNVAFFTGISVKVKYRGGELRPRAILSNTFYFESFTHTPRVFVLKSHLVVLIHEADEPPVMPRPLFVPPPKSRPSASLPLSRCSVPLRLKKRTKTQTQTKDQKTWRPRSIYLHEDKEILPSRPSILPQTRSPLRGGVGAAGSPTVPYEREKSKYGSSTPVGDREK